MCANLLQGGEKSISIHLPAAVGTKKVHCQDLWTELFRRMITSLFAWLWEAHTLSHI